MNALRARSLSLIEVVASLVLIATTITLLLSAHSRSLKQLSTVRHQSSAAGLAQNLIADWKIHPPPKAMDTQGLFEGRPDWRWRRVIQPFAGGPRNNLQEITLTIFRTDQRSDAQIAATYTWLERSDDQ